MKVFCIAAGVMLIYGSDYESILYCSWRNVFNRQKPTGVMKLAVTQSSLVVIVDGV